MSVLSPLTLGPEVGIDLLESGKLYAVPYREGHFIAMAAKFGEHNALVLLERRNCDSFDVLAVWVWPYSIPTTKAFELPGAFIEPAHASGTTAAEQPSERPRNGDLLQDGEDGLYMLLVHKSSRHAFSLKDGVAYTEFETPTIYRRWRIRQPGQSGEVGTIGEFESYR